MSQFPGLGAPQLIALCSHPLAAAAAILEKARAVILMLRSVCQEEEATVKLEEGREGGGLTMKSIVQGRACLILLIARPTATRNATGSGLKTDTINK